MPSRARAHQSEEDQRESRERILAAALEAFSERGFDGATTRDIAQRADVNLGLIQYYFEGKENLWHAAVERAFADLHLGLDRVLAEDSDLDARERARRMIRTFVRFVAGKPEFVRIMHDEGKRDGPRMRWLVDHYVRDFYERVQALLAGVGGPADGPAMTSLHYALVGSMVLMFHQAAECRYLTGLDPSDPEMVETHVRTLEQLLLGALNEETPQ